MKLSRPIMLAAVSAPFLAASAACGQQPATAPAAPPTAAPAAAPATTPTPAGSISPSGPASATASPDYREESADPSPGSPDYEAERQRIWTSPEMKEARQWINEYARRSARFKPSDAQRYLAKVNQMSPGNMTKWLARYHAHRANLARVADVERAARQTAVEQTLARLQAVQQSYDNLNQGVTEGALAARDRRQSQQQFSNQLAIGRQAERDMQMAAMYATDYSWIVNVPLKTRWMAAASLPGDLPPNDPRNFIRGDVLGPGDAPVEAPTAVPAGGPEGTEGGTGSR
jgi:hypothetical protein